MPDTHELPRSASVLAEAIGYSFQDERLLEQSLTHRSFTNEAGRKSDLNNERLEFLGDSVLDLIVSHLLVERYPDHPEGLLSKSLASLINEKSLAEIARSIELGDFVILGKGEEMTGGRDKDSILADTYEALIAAIYLDGGLDKAFATISPHFKPFLLDQIRFTDYKTQLQEVSQQRFKTIPIYKLVKQTGLNHQKTFQSEVQIKGDVYGQGEGSSKKESEQMAAQDALTTLTKQDEQ